MNRFLAILFLCPLALCGQGYDGTSLTGTNIVAFNSGSFALIPAGQTTPPGPDQPEGGWYKGVETGVSNATFTVQLPATIEAGTWRFQFKSLVYDNAEFSPNSWNVQFVLGGATNTARASDRGSSGYWLSEGVNVTSLWATNRLTLHMQTLTNADIKGYISAIFYTPNTNEDIALDGRDIIADFGYPATTSTTVDNTINLINCSSFEAGTGGWWLSGSQNREHTIYAWLKDGGDASHGDWALRIRDITYTAQSPHFYVKEDSRYHNFSVRWKGTGTATIRTAVNIATNYTAGVTNTISLPTVATWTTTNVSLVLRDYPHRTPYVVELTGALNTLFDGIMVVEGTNLVTFATRNGWEVGWSNSMPSGVYYSGEAAKPHVIVHNTGGARTVRLHYEFVNHFLEVVSSGDITAALADGGRLDSALTLPTNGWYRASVWGDGIEPQEAIIRVMDDPGPSLADFVGTHNFGRLWQIIGMEALGISHTRAMSPQAMYRIDIAQPTEGNFVFDDASVTNTLNNNGIILATLGVSGGGSGFPTYMASDGTVNTLDLSKWSNYWHVLVAHYAPMSVTNYECGNEVDNGSIVFTVSQYTNALMTAYHAATNAAAGTAIRIYAIGGSGSPTFVENVITALGAYASLFSYSIHGYPEGADPYSGGEPLAQAWGWHETFGAHPGLIWINSESGPVDWPLSMAASRYVMIGGGIYRHTHNRVTIDGLSTSVGIVTHAAAYKLSGAERFYHYDSRSTFAASENSWAGSWDLDDGHRPRITGLAAFNALVAGTTGSYITSPHTNLVAGYFENAGNSRAILLSTNPMHHRVSITNVLAYDYQMTPITISASNTFYTSRFPTYLVPVGLTSAQFRAAITNATVVAVADTFAPGLSIYDFPGSAVTDRKKIRARWCGLDKYATPSRVLQEELLFRSMLVGVDSDYDDWSTTMERVWLNVGSGNLTLQVQAKDAAGNITTQSRVLASDTTAFNFNAATFGTVQIR